MEANGKSGVVVDIGDRGKKNVLQAQSGDSGGIKRVLLFEGVLENGDGNGVGEIGGLNSEAEAKTGRFGAGRASGSAAGRGGWWWRVTGGHRELGPALRV